MTPLRPSYAPFPAIVGAMQTRVRARQRKVDRVAFLVRETGAAAERNRGRIGEFCL